MCLPKCNIIGRKDLIHICHMKEHAIKTSGHDMVIGRIFNAVSADRSYVWHIHEFLHLHVTTVACKTCQGHANLLLIKQH